MLPTPHVEAELRLADAAVRLQSTHWPQTLEHRFSDQRHLFAMYLSDVSNVEGRYDEDDEAGYLPLGPLFFRPANLHLNVRGRMASRQARAIHCGLDERRLDPFVAAGIDWTHRRLQEALDIRSPHLRAHFSRIIGELRQPGFAAAMVIDATLVLLVSDLVARLAPEASTTEESGGPADRVARRVRERVFDLRHAPPSVGELAALCRVSERHLLRLFRQHEGVSLIAFIRAARLERAMELLATTDMPLKALAHQVGFASHASFTTAFLREAGERPAEYRKGRRTLVAGARKA